MFSSKRICVTLVGFSLISGVWGCGNQVTENLVTNPGIEDTLDGNGLPRDWSFSVISGKYNHEVAQKAQSGKQALVVGGSGGAAEVQTNLAPVPAGTVLECEAWVQTELAEDGQPFIYTKFSRDDKTERSGMIPFNPKPKEWQKLHFFSAAEHDSSTNLAIRLAGEGLVRIDDVSMRVAPLLSPGGLISSNTLEKLDEKGVLKEWRHVFRATNSIQKVFKEGEASVFHMEGSNGWSVLCTHRAITSKPAKIIFQGAIRVTKGDANLKIDYIKQNNCFSSTVSPAGRSEWTFVTVESDPALVEQSEAIRIALSTASKEEFSADYTSLDVFVQH